MDIEVVSENAYARKVNVTVPATNVREAFDRAISNVMQKAKIPGFRQGKVPRHVAEQRFGPSIVADVAGELIQQGWRAAIDEHKLEPVAQPSVIEQGDIKRGEAFTFVIGVEVKPTIAAQGYEGLEVYWPKSEVTDDEVDRFLEHARREHARLSTVTGRPVQEGDTVQVQLTVKDGDQVVADEPGTLVRTAGDAWFKGLESFLIGLSIDEEKSGEVAFAADARNEDVAGRTLAVSAKVLAIQELREPELDDELAKEAGHDSVAAWRDTVRGYLGTDREENAKNQARANLLEKLIEANAFDVPQGMIDQNLRLLVDELRMQQARAGRDPKDIRFSQAQVADLRRRAVFAARGGLLLESVWTAEGITATDEDVEARLAELAEQGGNTIEQIRGWFRGDEAMEDFRGRIREEKTLDWLLDHAKVTHEPPVQPEAEATEAPAEAEAPKKKASKKRAAESEPAEAEPAEAAAVAEEPAAKPKKAAKKKVEAAPADDATAEAAPADEAAPAKPKPTKPKSAPKKKADAAE